MTDEVEQPEVADEADDASEPTAGTVKKKGAPPRARKAVKPDSLVAVKITKAGHGQVHTGQDGETYDWNDEVLLEADCALALEERHFVEIL
jgi:hypothetical protein